MYEVLIVGGGPAGLSAALVLGRCRRRVLLCDAGEPRNAVSPAVHGFLTRDGTAPHELRRIGRLELAAYPTVELRDVGVEDVDRQPEGFEATLHDGTRVQAHKLLLATGIIDDLPDVPGLRELYGKSVWHCPYCDGFEVRGRPLAVYGRGSRAVSELRALTRFSDDLTVCTDGEDVLEMKDRDGLSRLRVRVRGERVLRLEPRSDGLAVVFEDGPPLECGALFFATGCRQRSPLPERLGCKLAENGLVETQENEATGVHGVYAAGDASRSVLLAIVAAGEGATAAFSINRELLREEYGE